MSVHRAMRDQELKYEQHVLGLQGAVQVCMLD